MNWQKLDTESGANLWFLKIPNVKNLSFGVLINIGSRDEEWPEEAGLAHALEHMFFQGTNCRTLKTQKQIATYVEDAGGIMNAYTDMERTFYFHTIASEEIRRSLKVLGESLYHPRFPKKIIPIQMKVVIEELKNHEDDPDSYLNEMCTMALAPHPLSQKTSGLAESIKNFRKSDFNRFAEKYYHPGNFTFVAVGNAEPDKLLDLTNEHFPALKCGSRNHRISAPAPTLPETPLIIRKKVEGAHVLSYALIKKPAFDREILALNVFSDMLSGGMSFPFFLELREKKGYCYWNSASVSAYSDLSTFDICMATDPSKHEVALRLAFDLVRKHKNGVALLKRTKQMVRGRIALIDSTGIILQNAARRIALHGSPRTFEEAVREIESVNIEEIEIAVDKYLDPENFYTGLILPE